MTEVYLFICRCIPPSKKLEATQRNPKTAFVATKWNFFRHEREMVKSIGGAGNPVPYPRRLSAHATFLTPHPRSGSKGNGPTCA
eukprot:scaffold16119_cov162-Amphora_coffeaeformis.AAC.9